MNIYIYNQNTNILKTHTKTKINEHFYVTNDDDASHRNIHIYIHIVKFVVLFVKMKQGKIHKPNYEQNTLRGPNSFYMKKKIKYSSQRQCIKRELI